MNTLLALADRTPQNRERYVDFLRAISIMVVVFGHWLAAVVVWRDGEVGGHSALEVVDGMWALTWVLQVMPLFFFVGGFANLKSWRALQRRNGDYTEYLENRVARLMKPTAVFIAFWMALTFVLENLFVIPPDSLRAATQLMGAPLWFLGVYLLVVTVAPGMVWLHERFRIHALVGLAVVAATIDVVRIALEAPIVGLLNFAVVWLFVHQLGFFYADGTFDRLGRAAFATMSVVGLGALVALTNIGVYSRSMVGVDDGMVGNNTPPSICICALALFLVGVAMLARPTMSRRLERRRTWALTVGINTIIMTAYLWHLSAMALAVLVLYPLGWPQPETGTLEWWLLRPLWLLALTAFLVPFIALLGRFERPRGDRRPTASAAAPAASTR
ncbi:MAG: acyltransferase family protein [Actinomycetota bacterium]